MNETQTVNTEVKPYKYGIKKEIEKFHPEMRAAIRLKVRTACGSNEQPISRQTLHAWETYKKGDPEMIGADHFTKMAEVLGCRIEDLMPGEPEKKFDLYFHGKPVFTNKTKPECIGERSRLLGTGSYLRSNFEIKPATT